MSRNIADKTTVTLSADENAIRSTTGGKLLFTEYKNKKCALLIRNDRLVAASFFDDASVSKLGAVYLGKVKNVVENINACFVEIAEKEICFLPIKEATAPLLLNRKFDGRLLAGDELPVQVIRDAQKTKQATVTARVSLSNDYFAMEIGSSRVNYSLKLEKEKRAELAAYLQEAGIVNNSRLTPEAVQLPDGVSIPIGMIVRTKAGTVSDAEELSTPFKALAEEFTAFLQAAAHNSCFSCLKEPPKPFEQVLDRLVTPNEFDEYVTDNESLYEELSAYANMHTPDKSVRLYADKMLSLSSLYSLHSKLETALSERVWLKSGGYLIIQPTEALTVIDVNSGKYDAGKGMEETALKLNLEAAEEIALQLRLRNLSGIIIVDFINMREDASQEKLLQFMRSAVRRDKLQTTVVDMTPLGLVELTRKKEGKPLHEQLRK